MSKQLKIGDKIGETEVVVRDCIANQDHHWMIESPNGRTSPGVCKHCGETGLFENSSDKDWAVFRKQNPKVRQEPDYLNNVDDISRP